MILAVRMFITGEGRERGRKRIGYTSVHVNFFSLI